MKYLIIGLGNIGSEYENTRHNIGFRIAEKLAKMHDATFSSEKYGDIANFTQRQRQIYILKPNTYMNLSGKSVRYWMQQLQIPIERIFVLVDDLAIDFASIRIRGNGSDGGHNGLKSMQECLLSQQYARLRFGIGSQYPKGRQIDFVLGEWNKEEESYLPELIEHSAKACESFVFRGLPETMNGFNKNFKKP